MKGSPAVLARAIHEQTGIFLPEERYYLFDSRLGDVVRNYNLESYEEAARRLSDGDESEFVETVIDRISTHETRFFRDESLFDALAMQIIPEWAERNGVQPHEPGNARLDIWSAACSTGQEIYSIAMIIREKFPALLRNFSLTGSDISRKTLDRAAEGKYTSFEVSRGLPDHLRDRYFNSRESNYQISESLRTLPRFVCHNLLTPFQGQYDIIFCRNVLIYFNEEDRKRSIANLVRALKPDGVLALGSAESPTEYLENFIVREYGLARYYEPRPTMVTFFKQ